MRQRMTTMCTVKGTDKSVGSAWRYRAQNKGLGEHHTPPRNALTIYVGPAKVSLYQRCLCTEFRTGGSLIGCLGTIHSLKMEQKIIHIFSECK